MASCGVRGWVMNCGNIRVANVCFHMCVAVRGAAEGLSAKGWGEGKFGY